MGIRFSGGVSAKTISAKAELLLNLFDASSQGAHASAHCDIQTHCGDL